MLSLNQGNLLIKKGKKVSGKKFLFPLALINHYLMLMTKINHKNWEIILPKEVQQIQRPPLKKVKEEPEGDFSQDDQIEPNESKWEEKQKQIETYLECVYDSDYLMHISQILNIYKVDLKNTQIRNKIKEYSRVQFIEQQTIQNIFHFSAPKQFFKSFSQHTRKIHEKITLLIEKFYINNQRSCQVKQQKLRITILSTDNKILHIHSNITQPLQKFVKFVQNRFRRLKKIFCVEVGIKKRAVELNILKVLVALCESVVYVGVLCDQYHSSTITKKVTSEYGVDLGGVALAISQYDSLIFISQKKISQELQNKLIDKVDRLVKIQDLLMNTFTKQSPLSTRIFYQNEYCCCIFAFYFNLIKNYDQMQITQKAALSIQNQGIDQIIKSLEKFDSLKKKKKNNGQLCYPKLMDVSKKCWVCTKSKPKYICEGCSDDCDFLIYLCMDQCFKEFHKNKDKYTSKLKQHNKIRKIEAIEQEELDKKILKIPQSKPEKTLEQYEMESKMLREQITSSQQQAMKDYQKIAQKFLISFNKNSGNSLFQKSNYLLNIVGLMKKVQKNQSQLESDSMEIQESDSSLSIKNQGLDENNSFVE